MRTPPEQTQQFVTRYEHLQDFDDEVDGLDHISAMHSTGSLPVLRRWFDGLSSSALNPIGA